MKIATVSLQMIPQALSAVGCALAALQVCDCNSHTRHCYSFFPEFIPVPNATASFAKACQLPAAGCCRGGCYTELTCTLRLVALLAVSSTLPRPLLPPRRLLRRPGDCGNHHSGSR